MLSSADWSLVARGLLSQLWLSLEQTGNNSALQGPDSHLREPSSKRDAAMKQRDGDRVWSDD